MAYDPVLDREMFRPKSKGVEELRSTEESESVRARREQALAMIEAARQKFDPANYQTLTEQDRPGVFRPVAVNIPAQQQTADTAMRMQQMAAQGVRPVGMARGGLSGSGLDEYFWAAPYEEAYQLAQRGMADDLRRKSKDAPSYNEENISPTISSGTTESDDEYFDRLAKLRKRLKEVRDMPVEAETKTSKETPKKEETKKATSFDMSGTVPPRTDSRGAVLQMTPEEIAAMDAGVKGLPVMNPNEAYYTRRSPWTGKLMAMPVEKYRGVGPREAYDEGIPTSVPSREPSVETAAPEGGIANLGVPVAEPAAAPSGLEALRAPGTVQGGRVPGTRDDFEETVTPTPKAAKPAGITAVGAAQEAGAAPKLPDMSQAGPTDMQQIKAERARAREENINLALIRAGLGIMAGKSSNALANIGEGAQAGIGAFTEGEKTAQQQMREAVSDLREQQKMAQDKAYRESMLGFEKTKMGMESERLGLARDAATQNKLEFDQTLQFKKQESENALKSAEATRDATAIREASRQVSELRNTIITRIQMLQSSNQATIDPVGTKTQIEALTRQLEAAEQDANAIRKIQGLSLPSQNKPSATMSSDPLGLRGK